MIVATAGHVDHGKTTLVRALTGVDTDRLAEEKRRGLSIEPGFAYQQLPAGGMLGFVDVPGHQRFVHNMLACIAGVDLGLMVVAADDGPMPQTREHLDILTLLGVPALMIALTRVDRVDASRRAAAIAEVRALLAGGPYTDAPLHAVAATTGEGLSTLRAALLECATGHRAPCASGGFRLAVDRCFTLQGIGVIATGTVFAGRTTVGDRLLLMPAGRELRVRGLHADDRPAEYAIRGQRAALNLTGSGLRTDLVHRGDWLVAPSLGHASERLDARLRLLDSAPRSLPHWSEVHLHMGAAHAHARVAVLDAGAVAPGDEALVQLVADRPLHAVRGDPFVLRDQSARTTLGGGIVLDPFSPRRGRARPARLAWLRALANESLSAAFAATLATSRHGVDMSMFRQICNLDYRQRSQLLRDAPHRWLDTASGGIAIADTHWQALLDAVLAAISAFHERQPQSQGADMAALARALPERPPRDLLAAAAQTLLDHARLGRTGLMLHLPGHSVRLDDAQQAQWQQVAAALRPASGSAPTLHQLALTLGMQQDRLRELLRLACAAGLAVHVARNRYLPAAAAGALATRLESLAAQAGETGFSVADFRDSEAIGRNLAVDLLEYFDRIGLTRRAGERRHLAARAATLFAAQST